jgi:hypothetical protein
VVTLSYIYFSEFPIWSLEKFQITFWVPEIK